MIGGLVFIGIVLLAALILPWFVEGMLKYCAWVERRLR